MFVLVELKHIFVRKEATNGSLVEDIKEIKVFLCVCVYTWIMSDLLFPPTFLMDALFAYIRA